MLSLGSETIILLFLLDYTFLLLSCFRFKHTERYMIERCKIDTYTRLYSTINEAYGFCPIEDSF